MISDPEFNSVQVCLFIYLFYWFVHRLYQSLNIGYLFTPSRKLALTWVSLHWRKEDSGFHSEGTQLLQK